MSGVIEGACLCGAVTVRLPEAVAEADACHCGMCRKIGSGGPMFAVHCTGGAKPEVSGEEHITVYRSSDWAERAFCARCGTSLWYRFIEDDFHSVSAGLFDPKGLTLKKQIFIEEKPALYDLANETPKLTGEEVVAEYMDKMHGGGAA